VSSTAPCADRHCSPVVSRAEATGITAAASTTTSSRPKKSTVDSTTRYAACHTTGNTATWRPNLRAASSYQVLAYNIVHSGSDPAARYDTVHNGSTPTTVVNGTTGTSGWVSLGTSASPPAPVGTCACQPAARLRPGRRGQVRPGLRLGRGHMGGSATDRASVA
jgi:hypothetical protein